MIIKKFHTGPLGVNSYVVSDEETKKGFILDPGGYKPEMANYINENEITIEYIILTHGHGDHIGGVLDLQSVFPDIKIAAGAPEKSMIEDSRMNASEMILGYPVSFSADRYLNDGEILSVGNMELKIFHTPGHTKGGICILLGDVLFSGDTLFQQSIGRTDFPGGSFEEIQKAIREKLYTLPADTRVLPGHMGDTTIGFEKENNPFV